MDNYQDGWIRGWVASTRECEYLNFLAMEHDFLVKDLFASGYLDRHLQTTYTIFGSHLHDHLHTTARTTSERFFAFPMSQ